MTGQTSTIIELGNSLYTLFQLSKFFYILLFVTKHMHKHVNTLNVQTIVIAEALLETFLSCAINFVTHIVFSLYVPKHLNNLTLLTKRNMKLNRVLTCIFTCNANLCSWQRTIQYIHKGVRGAYISYIKWHLNLFNKRQNAGSVNISAKIKRKNNKFVYEAINSCSLVDQL